MEVSFQMQVIGPQKRPRLKRRVEDDLTPRAPSVLDEGSDLENKAQEFCGPKSPVGAAPVVYRILSRTYFLCALPELRVRDPSRGVSSTKHEVI
jgi:hypothetical protein